ncbi:MAG: hypothetical protein GY940_39990, partial [bacterium]|nr:hypothetical protein [bacterium]
TGIILPLDQPTRKGLDSDSEEKGSVGNGGVTISTLEDFSNILAGIDIENYPLHINPGVANLEMLMLLKAALEQKGKGIDTIKGSIDTDPLGFMLVNEGVHEDVRPGLESAFQRMAMAVKWTKEHAPNLKTIGISGLPYHHAGADAVQELACLLATGVEYIQRLRDRNVTLKDIVSSMRCTFAV